jgi:5-methylcytosine-specific restriction endonuclease McrA
MRKCLRCGAVEGITRDHVVPRVQLRLALGQDEYARFCAKVRKVNIQDLCGPCNNEKGDRTGEFRTDERAELLIGYLKEFGLDDTIDFDEFR